MESHTPARSLARQGPLSKGPREVTLGSSLLSARGWFRSPRSGDGRERFGKSGTLKWFLDLLRDAESTAIRDAFDRYGGFCDSGREDPYQAVRVFHMPAIGRVGRMIEFTLLSSVVFVTGKGCANAS